MSDLINSCLKEISSELNQLQMKKKDFIIKFEPEVKNQILLEMQEILQKIKEKFFLIEQELECSSGQIRTNFKSAIESNRLEYKKMIKEVDRFDSQIKAESLLRSKTTNYTNPNQLISKIDNNTKNLMLSKAMTIETVNRDKLTAQELEKQGNQLMGIHNTIGVAESKLTVVQQITDIMKYNDLFYRFKLYIVVVLLFFANIIVLYLKFR